MMLAALLVSLWVPDGEAAVEVARNFLRSVGVSQRLELQEAIGQHVELRLPGVSHHLRCIAPGYCELRPGDCVCMGFDPETAMIFPR